MLLDRSTRRWARLGTAVVLVGCGVAAASWVGFGSASRAANRDCAVVESVAAQWTTMSATIRDTLLNGAGEGADIVAAADREAAMAEQLSAAAGSVSTQEIKSELTAWAEGATRYAQQQRKVADRAPGSVASPPPDASFLRVALRINDAAVALGKLCPDMPTEPR